MPLRPVFHRCYRSFAIAILLLLVGNMAMAQETEEETEMRKNKFTIMLGHTHVPSGINEEGKKTWLALPSWGFDYDHTFDGRWGVGIHADFVVENFEFEDGEAIQKRSKPLAIAGIVSRKFGEHFTLLGGAGAEFAKESNLSLIRLGGDYGWELRGDWEISISLMADFKIDAYDAWVLGIGIGKRF